MTGLVRSDKDTVIMAQCEVAVWDAPVCAIAPTLGLKIKNYHFRNTIIVCKHVVTVRENYTVVKGRETQKSKVYRIKV